MADTAALQPQPKTPDITLPRTLNELFFAVVERELPRVMMYRQNGAWLEISSHELQRRVVGVTRALRAWGISRGDRVAILSENRPEWTIADFAILLLGAVSVPVYPTLTGDQVAHLLQDSGARAVFLSSEIHLRTLMGVKDQTPVERVVIMDQAGSAVERMGEMMRSGPDELDGELVAQAREIAPDDLATLIYTSGTTGIPKGVMLSHENVASNLTCSLGGFDVQPGDISLSFLPLSHITARHVDLAVLFRGACLAYVPFVEQLAQALTEVRPTFFVGVPRVYEKVHAQVDQRAKAFPARWIYRWALAAGRAQLSEVLAGRTPTDWSWKVADRLVYSKVRQAMGGRVRVFISGGAPLGRELATWFAEIGIRLHEGYGLTETSPVIAVNTPQAHKLGTVGRPLPNLQVRIADDGEILVRGPSVFKGYWKNPQETQNAFVDGWFKTGDIGNLDSEGFLSVTDRKKDLIKTSGGKFIAPQPIENSLKHNALIAEAVVLGEKRKFPAALISPYFPLLEDWAKTNRIAFSNRKELVSHPRVIALYEGIVEDLNRGLARFEQLKRVLLLEDEFTSANGVLTASLKVRRRAVEQRYQDQIEEMYRQAEEAGAGPR